MAPTVAKTTIKPYKLKATTGDKLTRDDLATWKEVLLSHCRQNEAWQKFLPTGDNKEWKAADSGERNVWNQDAAQDAIIKADFQDFLPCLSTRNRLLLFRSIGATSRTGNINRKSKTK